jgi:uracil-DNA glycosylase
MIMEEKIYVNCNRCKDYGLEFRSKHNISPLDFIDGNGYADIWIIGLNPKNKIGHIETRSLKDFKLFDPNGHRYFRDFKKVSEKLYKNWERPDSNIAHTDIVKCFSETFPPIDGEYGKNNQRAIIDNCIEYLKLQILKYMPKMIICNGTPVSWEIIRLLPPNQDHDLDCITSYCTKVNNHNFWIVLSGFIGRIDNRNKRRLGMEIERIIEKENFKIE